MLNREKLSNLVNILSKYKIDGYLMGPSFDLEYFSGISSFSDERFKDLFVLDDGRWFFICPELYYEDFRKALGEDAHMYVWSDNEGVSNAFESVSKEYQLN